MPVVRRSSSDDKYRFLRKSFAYVPSCLGAFFFLTAWLEDPLDSPWETMVWLASCS